MTIPAGAHLWGAFTARPDHGHDLAFGMGRHICPARDLNVSLLWSFAVRVAESYMIEPLDETDVPKRDSAGVYPHRGFFARFARFGGTTSTAAVSAVPAATPPDSVPRASAASRPDRSERIAILGGGISGLTVAHELRKRGFQNVVVFEQADSVGGKADTIEVDGRRYNLGAHLCNGHLGVAELCRDAGVGLVRERSYTLWDIDENRPIRRRYGHFAEIEKFQRFLEAHPEIDSDPGFAATEGWMYPAMAPWLEAHDLVELGEQVGAFYTGAGYGFMDQDVPAAFFMKFARHMTNDGWTPQGGYKNLLQRVAEGIEVRCGAEVTRVERGHAGAPEGAVRVAWRADGASHSEAFDKLVLTGPLEHAGRYLDATPDESALFSRIRSLDYYTVVATLTIEDPHPVGLSIVEKHTSSAAYTGHVTAFARMHEDARVYHFWCYGRPDQTREDILEIVRADARRMGGEIATVHAFRKWAYFPHVSPHDMAMGFYRRLEAMQGAAATYYAGSLLAFELTDYTVSYAKSLVERFFAEDAAPLSANITETPASRAVAGPADSVPRIPERG
ncbi:MAG: FAD-dependent oxidoreductase, partial [Byssovorax sp.]